MDLLNFLCSIKKKRLVSENDFMHSRSRHADLAAESLRNYQQPPCGESVVLEYFFYADTLEKAQKLECDIQKIGYIVNHGVSRQHKDLFVISGRTYEINKIHETLSGWADDMCELGYRHDCRFEDWRIVVC